MSELFTFQREGLDENGNILGGLKATGIVPGFHKKLVARGIDLPIAVFNPEGAW